MKKPKNLSQWLIALAYLGAGTSGFAQVQTSVTAFTDVHPFQTQITYRSNEAGLNNGAVEVMPSVIAYKYTYYPDGASAKIAENTALLYDKRNPLPATSVAGLNYTFYQDRKATYMSTVSADGTFTYKGMTNFKVATHGGVYFTEFGTNNLVMVDSYGFYWNSFTPAPAIRLTGGNYFIDAAGFLTTFKSMGAAPGDATGMKTVKNSKDDPNFSDAVIAGGNFFVKKDGSIVTVSSVTGFYSDPYTPESAPKVIGGNYFIGADNYLYTIDSDGVLNKNKEFIATQSIALTGYSFVKFADGSFFFVDGTGIPHRTLLRVSTNGTKVEELKTLPDTIDTSSLYSPSQTK